MKRHISAVFAVLAVMACSKVAPEDRIPVSENPEGDKQEESVEPKGEGITIQLAQTKVTLGENVYQFEGNEQIYVKARSGESTVMTNTPGAVNTFTGEFNNPLGKESDTFDFYFNCTDGNGERSFVQNGQPWLVCEGVNANRVNQNGNAYYIVKGVELAEFSDYVALALISPYDCTVDFHSISAKIPYVSGKALPGITLTKTNKSDDYTKPYFVNVSKGLTGGFYLAVSKTGETGTMYTSYATATTISKNTTIKIKDFTPLSITGELSGFNTSYSIYTDSSNANRVADANSVSNDYMSRGSLTLRIAGISNSLLSLVSLESITIGSSDEQTLGFSTSQPVWSNKEYTWYFNDPSSHTTWGELTVTATAVFKTPAGKVTADVPALSRHITGLPNTLAPSKEYWRNVRNSGYLSYETGYIQMYGSNTSQTPLIESIHFHIPSTSLNVSMIGNFYITSHHGLGTYPSIIYSYIGGTQVYKYKKESNGGTTMENIPMTGSLTSSKPYVEYEAKNANVYNPYAYCQIYSTEVKYN
ncbi:MAG: hypothetical protein SOZ21_00380 [Candidatus Cryptobacteroides sp.]|nr:hypothetical protein [Candidatus Cryptobacteroides sp.]